MGMKLKRNQYSSYIGEGRHFIFEKPNICVSVAWYGAAFDGTYKITFAWKATKPVSFPNYPFIKTARDKQKIASYIRQNETIDELESM